MTSLLNLLLASFLAMGAAPAPAAQAATAAQGTPPAGKNTDAASRAAQKPFQRKFLAKAPADHGNGLPR